MVRALHFVPHDFANIVQERTPGCYLNVSTQLGRENPGDLRNLYRMRQLILSIARAVFHAPKNLQDFWVETMDVRSKRRLFASFEHTLFDFLSRLRHDLLNPRRMD